MLYHKTVFLVKKMLVLLIKIKIFLDKINTKQNFSPAASSSWCLRLTLCIQAELVGFVLSLIYSFRQWQTYSKTIAHKLCVELTSVIMQFCRKKSPIVSLLKIPAPPTLLLCLNAQVNKFLDPRKYWNSRHKNSPGKLRRWCTT